jgi:hypothetical protein
MKHFVSTALRTLAIAGAMSAPAFALDNPMVVDVHGMSAKAGAASATIFARGDNSLVNVNAQGGIPKNAAVTLNDGSCDNPGGVAFALAPLEDDQSMTTLNHPLTDIAGKAKSMVVHQTSSETSPAAACGNLKA